ncbi:MAG TPA: PQQ-binding-like beta-propeller repeat protein [Bryobacteraceae bacterium]|nr:PQQ-binding-like beta-propeller repeat protein [Bryobacteraceae bacterium]
MNLLITAFIPLLLAGSDWTRFRGPNGSGVSSESKDMPAEYGDKNLVWKIALPAGYSSPILAGDKVFVTAYDKDALYAMALDRKTGKVLWRRESTKNWPIPNRGVNTPVSPTPVSDGKNVYLFFEGVGLVSYGPDGDERWRVPLGPFINPYGIGSSPILAGDKLLWLSDNDTDSYLLAVSIKDGKQLWKTPRPDVTHGFSTPILYTPKNGPVQAIVSGSYNVVSYSVDTGEKLWWVGGMAWQAKSLPVIHDDTLYIHSWMADMAGIGLPSKLDSFDDVLKTNDKDHDGKLVPDEIPYKEMKPLFFLFDLNRDGFIDRAEWDAMLARNTALNGVYAIKLDGNLHGDLTKTNVLWRYNKSLPNIPSPLLYENVLYVLKEGGILTTLNPATGEIIKQARIKDALDPYFASPIAADGKVFTLSQSCKLGVLKAAGEWEVLAVNKIEDGECWATPAIADNQIFVRTQTALYCFAKKV